MPACSSLVCFFNRGNTEATNSLKHYRCNDICFAGNDFVDWHEKVFMYVYIRGFEVCVCLWQKVFMYAYMTEFDCPEVTLCGTLQALLSSTFLHTLPELVMPLKGRSLSLLSCLLHQRPLNGLGTNKTGDNIALKHAHNNSNGYLESLTHTGCKR